jgi:hypothetical protein
MVAIVGMMTVEISINEFAQSTDQGFSNPDIINCDPLIGTVCCVHTDDLCLQMPIHIK